MSNYLPRILRYIIQGILIFLLFNYTPGLKMNYNYALIITLSILLITVLFEQYIARNGLLNILGCGGCGGCEGFNDDSACKVS